MSTTPYSQNTKRLVRTGITLVAILSCVTMVTSRASGDFPPPKESSAVNAPTTPKHTNRLAKATSPYLLQHAHNPVDWYEWGEEALARARAEDKPIFLSIGYSACHWCHVMAHECFEKEDVADILNEYFVSIKVDREERPDIDEIYMAYTQALTGGGGWPMSVWLTPDGHPFHAGTYFPKAQFEQILHSIADSWTNERERIVAGADGAKRFYTRWATGAAPAEVPISLETVDSAAERLSGYFDRTLGGIPSGSNKFPPSMSMDLLLRVYRRTKKSELRESVEITLDHMAGGGIYDHLGGGICRYSTDGEWLVPHFEKMLYDQAMVASIFLDAFQVARKPLYARTAAGIFDYVMTDLQSPKGGFYSARDADSDGLEGAFYVWTVKQVQDVLGEEEAKLFCAYYDVTETGNWFESRGHAPAGPKNILHVSKPPEAFAKLHDLDATELNQRLKAWRVKLLAVRARRTPPSLDDKVLTGWNGLMIAALAKGARVLHEPRYAEAAGWAAGFILDKLRRDGRLLRTYRAGQARLTAYLSDYAFLVEGLLNLYEATFERRWLDEARALTDTSIRYYFDADKGAFFFTAADGEKLIARSKQPRDGAIPSGNSVHAMNLLRLSVLLDRKDYREKADSIFKAFGAGAVSSPGAYDRLLCAADFAHDRVREIAVIGRPDGDDTKALLRAVYERYLPNKVVVGAAKEVSDRGIPLLAGKTMRNHRATAYVCEHYRCKLPVTSPEELGKQLDAW